MAKQTSDWTEKAEQFRKIRRQIKLILKEAEKPLDFAEIAIQFKDTYRHLPNIERRLRELVASGDVTKNHDKIPTYTLTDQGWLSLH